MSARNRFLRSLGLKLRRQSKGRHSNESRASTFRVEPLEPRILLDAEPLVFAGGADALDAVLTLADVAGVATVQFIDSASGNVLASRALSGISAITVTGSGQDDVLTIDLAESPALAAIPIAFDGAAGLDAIVIAQVSFDLVTYNAIGPDAGAIVLGSTSTTAISYTGIENVLDITDATSRLFQNQTGTSQNIRLADDGEFNGFTLIDSNDTAGFTPIFFAEPTSGVSMQAGDAGDRIILGELESDFAAPLSVEGGAGADTLELQASDGIWTVTSHNTGVLNDGVTFTGIENLTGGEDTNDTFTFEAAGSLSGTTNGGEGGVDNIIVRSATDTAIVVPDASGTATFDGRIFNYAGIEPFVDSTDPATTRINGTLLADDIILEVDPALPAGLRIRVNNARFLVNSSLTGQLTFAAPTDALLLDLREGDDLLTYILPNPAPIPRLLVAGGGGTDRLTAPDTPNLWQIDAEDTGVLNDVTEFFGFENIVGGSASDVFSITETGNVTGTLDGGGGLDELKLEVSPGFWTITGLDAGHVADAFTLEAIAEFVHVESLYGSAESEDTFYFEAGGSITELVDGGAGSVDQLIIEGVTDTVLVLPDISGVANFDGRVIQYSGLEPVVDATDPAAVTVQATATDDDLTLSGNTALPGDPHSVELRSTAYAFLDDGVIVDSLIFSATDALTVFLRQGDDVFGVGSFNSGFDSTVSIDGGTDDDTLKGPDSTNSWLLEGLDSGVLNTRFHFDAVEHLSGGSETDNFSISADGVLTGTLSGNDGDDELFGPSQSVAWNVTGEDSGELTDQLSGGTLVKFAGISGLVGHADNTDSFIISVGGSLSGAIKGGDGGWDSLVVRGTPDTVVQPGILFGSVFPDTATINGVPVTYEGLEPFVDDTNPADVVINGTGVNDDLTLAPDTDNPGHMRISGSSGFLFYTDGQFSDGISFVNPAIGLSINLRFGSDTLTIDGLTVDFDAPITINGGFGLDTVTIIQDMFLPGKDLTINAENITVSDNVTISTRDAAGVQDRFNHLNGASTGKSGNITFNAESSGSALRALAAGLLPALSEPTGVTIGADAALLAHVDADHLDEFTPGNIAITARDENGLGLPGFLLSGILNGIYRNRAEIVVNDGAILRAGNLSLDAGAKFSPQSDFLEGQIFDSFAPYSLQETRVGELLGQIPATVGTVVSFGSSPLTGFLVKKVTGMESLPLQILGKIAEARVDVRSEVELTATGHVTLVANAVADATTKVANPLFSVALSVAHATAEVLVGSDVDIDSGGNVNVIANASATAKSESSTTKNDKTPNPQGAGSLTSKTFSLAISESQANARATVAESADIHAGGNVNIVANGISTNEAAAKFTIYLDGTFGISAGLGFATSDIHATVGGTMTSDAEAASSLDISGLDDDKDTIDFGANHGLYTGQALVYHAGSTEIEKLSDGKTYYVIAEPGSTKIKLAASLADAIQGKAISFKVPSDGENGASLENLADGITVTATLESEDKASAEAKIGDKASSSSKLATLAGSETVKKIVGKIPIKALENKRQEIEGPLAASGASAKPSDYSIAGAVAFSRTDHNVTAEVSADAVVKSRGDVEIRASQTEKFQMSAETSIDADKAANAKKKKSGSVALTVGLYNSEAHALVGDGAAVDAAGEITVDSRVLYPFLTEPTELVTKEHFTSFEGLKKLRDILDLKAKLLNSWTVSEANADELAMSGSISWLVFNNVSEAKIGLNAEINQDLLYQDDAQPISVTATTEMQLVTMTGVFDFEFEASKLKELFLGKDKLAQRLAALNPLGPGFETEGKGFGGGLFVMGVDNRTTATIGAGAHIRTGSDGTLNLKAESKMFDLAMIQSGGSGGKFGVAGSFSIINDDGVTWANIESGAQIDGGAVTLEATDNTNHWNMVGGVMKGEARGVGASVAINLVDRDTAAFIGAEAGADAGSGTSIQSTGDITLTATGTGNLHTFTLAAAFQSNKPMKGDPEDPLDGVSLPILFGDAKPEEEPAKTGLAVAANVSWNTIFDRTRAYINDTGTITGDNVSLTAHNDRGIVAASGAAAIAKTTGSESSTALAGAFSRNRLQVDTLAFINAATIEILESPEGAGEITLTARRDGLLFSFSGGGAGAPTEDGTGGMGSVSINRILNTTTATLDGVTLHTAGDVTLIADDASQIIAIAGAGAYGESKGVGGAIAINQIAGMTEASILGDLRRSAIGDEITPAGNVSLLAANDNSIQAIALSVGVSQGGGLAVTLGINLLTDNLLSGVENSATATIRTTDIRSAGDVLLQATDGSTLEAVGGAIGLGKEDFGFGAALGWNQVNDDVSATIEDAIVTTSGSVHLAAEVQDAGPLLEGKIVSASVGAAGSTDLAIGGALSINVIHDTVDAQITAGSSVTAADGVILSAKDSSSLKALTGGVAISTGDNAAGAAIGVNDVSNTITAAIDDATVTSTGASVELGARSDAKIGAITVGGTGADDFAIGGSIAVNLLRNTVEAHVTNGAEVTAHGPILVSAVDNGQISGFTGGLAFTKSNAVGAAIATNDILNTTKAYIDNATVSSLEGGVTLDAKSAVSILAITVGGSGAQSFAIGGSITVNIIRNRTEAYISSSSDVEAHDDIRISATEQRQNDHSLDLGSAHGFVTGDAVVYDSGGGSSIGGLLDGGVYYVIVDAFDPGKIRLAASHDDAIAGVAITIDPALASGSLHNLTKAITFVPASAIDEDAIDLGADHGLYDGAAVLYDNGGGTDIGGLDHGQTYYVIQDPDNPNRIRLAASSLDALLGIAIDIDPATATGAAHVLRKGTSFNPAQTSTTTHVVGIAGGIAGAGKKAVGAALATNDIANQTKAYIDSSTVNALAGGIEIEASSQTKISALTIGGSGAGTFAAGGSIAVNLTLNTIDAHVVNSPDVQAAGAISVTAKDDSAIDGGSGGIAGAGQNAIGAALMTNDIVNTTTAYIDNSAATANEFELIADSDAVIRSIAVGGSGAGNFALGGSLSINIVGNTIDAHVSNGSDVLSTGDVLLSATDRTTIFAGAGGLAFAGSTAIGAALASNDTANTTTAFVTGSTVEVSDGSVALMSDSLVDIKSATVSGGGAGTTNVNGSIAVHVTHNETSAYIGPNSEVNASGNVIVSAADDIAMLVGAGNLGGAGSNAVGVSSSTVITSNTTTAYVDAGAVVSALGNEGAAAVLTGERGDAGSAIGGLRDGVTYFMIVDSNGKIRLAESADNAEAGIAIDLDPAEASGNSHALTALDSSSGLRAVFDPSTAVNGPANSIDVGTGHGFKTGDAVVYEVPQGDKLTETIRGLSVTAVSFENVISIAVGGQGAGSIGGAGSVTVSKLDETTQSYIGAGASINAGNGEANAGQSVNVRASDATLIFALAGALGGGGSAGIGAGVDVGHVTKRTEAYVDDAAVVNALNDVTLHARSVEDIRSITAALGAGGSAGIGGATGVYVMNLTTRASIGQEDGAGATVHAGDSVLVSSEDSTELDLIAGTITGAGAVSVGAAAAVPIIHKTTSAFIGENSTVIAMGNGDGTLAHTGVFDVTFEPEAFELGEVPSPLFFAPDGITADVTGDDIPDFNDPQLTGRRIATPLTTAFKGVAVTAVNRDDIEAIGASGGGAGTVSVAIGGAVNVVTAHTRAFIAEGATINPDLTEAASEQSVLVAAGNDYAHAGIALAPAGAGTVAVTPGADVTVVNNTTEAFIADGAEVNAAGNIIVSANAAEDILSLSAGVALSGVVSVGGAVSVIVINNETFAHIGAGPAEGQNAASAFAGGSILVSANDMTDIDLAAGSLGVGIAGGGGGAAVGVTVVHKDTQAFIGEGAIVDAKGNGAALTGLYDGNIDATGFSTNAIVHGLAVQAASSENLVSVAAAGGGGFYAGIAGGVSAAVVESDTKAFIGVNAQINEDQTGVDALQDVNVTALNSARALGVTGGLGIGIAGIGGAVDVGVIRNNTAAFIGDGASVHAANNVDVNALSLKNVHTLAVAAAGGIVGAVGSVSVWTIGSEYDSNYTTDDDSHDALATTGGATYPNVQGFIDAMAGGKVATNGYTSILKGHSIPVFNPSTAVNNTEDTIVLSPNHGLHQGDAVVYRNGGGNDIGGLDDGERYYVILDADSPNRIQLASSQSDALNGLAIDLDASTATGSTHALEPYTGSITKGAGETIEESAPENEVGAATSTGPSNGVTAFVAPGATIVVGGNVAIHAEEFLTYTGQTGSVAVGLGGIGGSVTIANIRSHTDAHIGNGAAVTAGGVGSSVAVVALLTENVSGSAFAGQAGLIAAGAQVVVLNDSSTQMSYIGDGAVVEDAGTVTVLAGAERTLTAGATGGGVGAVSVGAAVAVVGVHGGTSAFVDGATIGRDAESPDANVGALIISADAVITAKAHTIAVQAGLAGGAVNGSVAVVTVDPEVAAYIGDDADILVLTDVTIEAWLETEASAEALGVSVDPSFGLGASVAVANLLPAISATVGSNAALLAGNDITLRSSSNYARNGSRLTKGVRATATSGSGGLGLAGAGAFATANHSPDVETSIGQGSTISAGNDIQMIAAANALIPARMIPNPLNPAQQIEIGGAQASGAGFGALGVGVSVSSADIGGSVLNHIDGATVTAGHDLHLASEFIADATAKAWAVSGGIAGGSGNKTTVDIHPTIDTYLGAGSVIGVGGDVSLVSNSEGNIEADARGLSVAGLSIGVSLVDAALTPEITTFIASSTEITAGGNVSLVSLHNYGAEAPLARTTLATGNASGGGLLSGNGADVSASSSADVESAIRSGAEITAGQDVVLVSRAYNEAKADSTGASFGVVGIGAIFAHAEANGSTRADIGNGAAVTAGRDAILDAEIVSEGVATATASSGGLASGNGADAQSIVSPAASALVGNLTSVIAGRDVLISAQAETHSTANATGTTNGGISVGASNAEAETHPVVSAGVGTDSVIQAGQSITISASYNIADDGSGINTVRATATGSAGSLLVGILAGADANAVADVETSAIVGDGAHLDITEDLADTSITIASRAYNSVDVDATGNAGGLFAGNLGASGTRATALVTTHADVSIGDGAAIGGQPALQGNLQDVTIASVATTIVNGSATGASGKDIAGALADLFSGQLSIPSILSGGGSVIDIDIENGATTSVGAFAEIHAEGLVAITADSKVEVDAGASMSSGGVLNADAAVLVDVFVDLDAGVIVGDGARIDGGVVLLGAHNQIDGDATATALANVSLGVADGAATTRFNVGSVADPSQALVFLGENVQVSGREALSMEALTDQADGNLLSKATAKGKSDGILTGDALAEANGTVRMRSTVESGEGSALSSGGLSVNADSTVGIDRIADADAISAVTEFVREARTVVRRITRWLPWPLNKIVEFVTETIFVLVPRVTSVGSESAKSTGSGALTQDTVNLNGDIFSVGNQNGLLIVHEDPNDPDNIVIDPSSNMSAELVDVDGDGTLDISVGNVISDSSGNINITAPKGDIIGSARVHINKVIEEVRIINHTDLNLVLNRLDMVSTNEEDPDLNFQSDNEEEYEVVSEVSSTTLIIENNGVGDIIFAQPFSNPTALMDVYNQGGNIRFANADVYLQTGDAGHLSITAEAGDIGTVDLPLQVQLVRGKVLPDGSVSFLTADVIAFARGNIYLDVTGINNTFAEFDPDAFVDGIVLDVEAAAGDVTITAHTGQIIEKVIEETTETQATRAAHAVYEFKNVVATLGNVSIDVTGDINAGVIDAPEGTTTINVTGSILHADNVFVGEPAGPNVGARNVLISAGAAIGDPLAFLVTEAGNLEADVPVGIWILDSGPLTVGGITEGPALQSDGPIVVRTMSPLTVIANVISATDIVLSAGDSPEEGDDLIVTNDVTIESTGGSITLAAGDNFQLDAGSSVIAAGAIHIIVGTGDADSEVGGVMVIGGTLQGDPVTLSGGAGNDVIVITHVDAGVPLTVSAGGGNDTVVVGSHATPTSNNGGTLVRILDSLTVDGGAGVDQLLVDESGELVENIGAVDGGTLTGLGLVVPIEFQNIDSLVVELGAFDDVFFVGNADAQVTVNLRDGEDRIELGAMTRGLIADLGAGNDKLQVSEETTGDITAYGGAGNDHIEGGSGDDIFFGGDDNDQLDGAAGNDILSGDAGNDRLIGGSGDDVLIGGAGNDQLVDNNGNNVLIGGLMLFDNDLNALLAIRSVWSNVDVSVQEGTQQLTFSNGKKKSGVFASFTVLDDRVADSLRGNFADWLIVDEAGLDEIDVYPRRR